MPERQKMKQHLHEAIDILKKHKLRLTTPRKKLLTILATEHGPFSIEDLHEKMPHCDLVTVYRNLASLEKTGIVVRCDFSDGVRRYEFSHQEHHHHHVICKVCKKVEELSICFAAKVEKTLSRKGYKNITHSFEIFATCPGCS